MKVIKVIVCIVLAVIVSVLVVGIAMQAVVKFELAMLDKLILPIIIVAIPAYFLIYVGLFKKKHKKDE